jgi:MYND finger
MQLTVSQSLNRAFNMLAADSQQLFGVARSTYQQLGRGSLVCLFPNLQTLESDRMNAWQYMTRDSLRHLDYSQVLCLVDRYNPETHFVALAMVNIGKPRAGKDNAIMACTLFGKDTQQITSPNFGADGKELHCLLVPVEDITRVQRGEDLMCAASYCNNFTNLRVCMGCRDTRYCSKDCQVSHWAQHKKECQALKAAKAQAKEQLRVHAPK